MKVESSAPTSQYSLSWSLAKCTANSCLTTSVHNGNLEVDKTWRNFRGRLANDKPAPLLIVLEVNSLMSNPPRYS